jgi:hypothetical protein
MKCTGIEILARMIILRADSATGLLGSIGKPLKMVVPTA